jgi:hypothetical protein
VRWLSVVVAGAACYQPIEARVIADAPARDGTADTAPADAAFTCPAGNATPAFSPQAFPAVYSPCGDYSVSEAAQRVVATCDYADQVLISEGGLVGELSPVAAFGSDGVHVYDHPRLSPAGDELFVRVIEMATGSATFARYARDGSGWSFAATETYPNIGITDVSAPTAGTPRTMLIDDDTDLMYELAETSTDSWSIVGTYAPSDLGMTTAPFGPVLTDDGLHVVFGPSSYLAGSDWIYYAARADPGSAFGSAQPLLSAPMQPPAYLESSCGRMYYEQDTHLDYVDQQ